VIRAVAGTAVPMAPSVISRQELIERIEEVVVRSRPELDDHDPGGGVRHEHAEQAMARIGFGENFATGFAQVNQTRVDSAVNEDLARLHRAAS
jgi:hypothetical protein